jgi:hypothetical protein
MQWLIAHLIGFGGAFAVVAILMLTTTALKQRQRTTLPETLTLFPAPTSHDTQRRSTGACEFRQRSDGILILPRSFRDAS